jgi:hypothetical protein
MPVKNSRCVKPPHIAISEQASVEVVKIKAASPQKKPQARYTLRVVRKFVAYLGF